MSDNSNPITINVGNSYARRSWIFLIISVLFVGYLIVLAWTQFGPSRPVLNPERKNWVRAAAVYIADDLAKNKGEIRSIVISDFSLDPSGETALLVRQALQSKGSFDVMDKSFCQKVWDKLNLPLSNKNDVNAEAPKAGKYAQSRGADAAVWGTCVKLENSEAAVIGDIEYYLIDKTGKTLYSGRYNNETLKDSAISPLVLPDLPSSWGHRLLGWVLLALLFPIITISFLQSMTSKKSNKINAFVLVLYTAVDGILAYIFFPPEWANIVSVLIFLGMIIVAGAYNLIIMDFARKLEED